MAETQSFANHTRWFPLFHFIITPLFAVLLIWALACVVLDFAWFRVQTLSIIVLIGLVGFAARSMALKVQDRLIVLEEKLRYERLLGEDLAKASSLTLGEVIALRFASDAELPGLVDRTVAGEFATPKEIKMTISNWRADHARV